MKRMESHLMTSLIIDSSGRPHKLFAAVRADGNQRYFVSVADITAKIEIVIKGEGNATK